MTLKNILIGGASVIAIIALAVSIETVELGFKKVYQNTLTKTEEVYDGPNWFIRPPIVSEATEYKNEVTVVFTDNGGVDDFSRTNPLLDISFADTYIAKLPLSVRLTLPTDPKKNDCIT